MKCKYDLYSDMEKRTGGELYLGVVGPVRTGKSTFIKKFMELLVLPNVKDTFLKDRIRDELPQSAEGKTIMTTEPKFVPKEAITIALEQGDALKVRLIDCVGYLIDGINGRMEDGKERKVTTPWSDIPMTFSKAAEMGTKKVITDHANVGIVVTTDGSFGELSRASYEVAEERIVSELKELGKPFIILVNSSVPKRQETTELCNRLKEKYQASVRSINCEQLKEEDILHILEQILYEFPVASICMFLPKWLELLDCAHEIKKELFAFVKQVSENCIYLRDLPFVDSIVAQVEKDKFPLKELRLLEKNLATGVISYEVIMEPYCYYQVLSELTGMEIKNETTLIQFLHEMAQKRGIYEKISLALKQVSESGYAIVTPQKEAITLGEPEVMKSGSRFGVKLQAKAPSIHMIQTNIVTEIAPIVGSKEQAEDLITYIKESETSEAGIWNTNIFGKTIEQIVEDGIERKTEHLSETTRARMMDSLERITNDANRGVICIIV